MSTLRNNSLNPPVSTPAPDLPRWITWTALLVLFAIGLGVRLYDLTDPPLESPLRPLHSAIIARGMYYQMRSDISPDQRQQAVALWQNSEILEPPIFERLVALTYLLAGGEYLWIARLYAILFWMVGGVFFFLLARRFGGDGGALVALGYYLILPFGVYLSRQFQPDPLMVMGILIGVWSLVRWQERKDWRSALAAGVLCGLAILFKVTAVFFVAPVAVAVVLWKNSLGEVGASGGRPLRNRQVWAMAGIMVAIPALYYLFSIRGRSQGYFLFWNVSYSHLLAEPWFYVRWLENLNNLIGLESLWLALAGLLILPARHRLTGLSLWVGYVLYGLAFPFQIHTHDYYSLILAAIIPLSFAALAGLMIDRLRQQARFWQVLFVLIAVVLVAVHSWNIRLTLYNTDSRVNWQAWQQIGRELPRDGSIIALTHDYGLSIQYFANLQAATWPTGQDVNAAELRGGNDGDDFSAYFARLTQGYAYFLVTYFGELDNQPDLKAMLYDHYPIYKDGDGYLVFDLRHPK